MDIVKARKKAKKKGSRKKPKGDIDKQQAAQETEPPEQVPERALEHEPDQVPVETVVEEPVEQVAAEPSIQETKVDMEVREDDIFEDMAFGEDIPRELAETLDSGDAFDLDDDMTFGLSSSMEPQLDESEPESEPMAPEPRTPEPRPPEPQAPRVTEVQPPNTQRQTFQQVVSFDQPLMDSDADDQEAGLGMPLDRLVTDEDDFFSLVSEDLFQREFGEDPDEDQGGQLELMSFDLASEAYAVRLTHIQQIIKMREITSVPRAPEYVLGIISLRGVIIPVFDLRLRLGLPLRDISRQTRIIVLSDDLMSIGLMVDRVRQVVRIADSAVEPPPPILSGGESEYLEGIGRRGKRMLILLDLHKVLGSDAAN